MIVIDAIDGDWARLELNGEVITVPTKLLPEGALEGAVLALTLCDNGASDLHRENEERLKRLQERDDGEMNIEL